MIRRTRFVLCLALLGMVLLGCSRPCCPPAEHHVIGARRAEAVPTYPPPLADGRDQFFIDMVCARVDPAEPLPGVALDPDDGPADARLLTEAEARRWQDRPHLEIVQAPKVLAVEDQEASLWVGETVSHQAHLDETGPASGADRHAPAPDFFGTLIFVRATNASDGRIEIDFRGAWKRLDPAIARLRDNAAGFERAVADLPVARAAATFTVADRRYVLIPAVESITHSDGTSRMLTLMRVVRMRPPEADRILIETGPRIDDPEDTRLPR